MLVVRLMLDRVLLRLGAVAESTLYSCQVHRCQIHDLEWCHCIKLTFVGLEPRVGRLVLNPIALIIFELRDLEISRLEVSSKCEVR